MSERDEFGAFLVGFIIGGLTGAAVSLLLAPQSGIETRALIKEKAIEIGDKASETYEDTVARAEAAAAEARTRADEWAKIARERSEELQHRGQVVLEEQRSRLTNVIETARRGGKPAGDNANADSGETTPSSAATSEG
jgi:gas vesicle protein